jgi:hypothetical protein
MQMVKRNEAQVFERINELTMLKGMFSDGPYHDVKSLGRQPFPERQRNTDYVSKWILNETQKSLSTAINCRGALSE